MRTLCPMFVIAAALASLLPYPAHSQPELRGSKRPPIQEIKPLINSEARDLMTALQGKYLAMGSYSDKTLVTLENGKGFPRDMRDSFPLDATLVWKRPEELRFEGTMGGKKFLALSDSDAVHAINPSHPGIWIERDPHPPVVVTNPDGTKTTFPPAKIPPRLDAAVFESGAMAMGLAFMTDPDFWARTMKDVTVLALGADEEMDRQACQVVSMQAQSDQGHTSLMRLWIAREDGLIRRLEMTFPEMGPNTKMIETHSNIRINPQLTEATWAFEPPAGAKPIEYFPNDNPHQFDPALRIGDALPTFSGDDLKGQPIELNAKSGKVTVVNFFLMSMGSYDLQTLQKLQKTVGSDKLQVVAVSGDALQGRLEKFAEKYRLTIPIYFDEGAMRNQLAQKFGVQGWSQVFIFGQDGKLKTICHMAGEMDFQKGIKKLLPDTLDDAFILQNNEFIANK